MYSRIEDIGEINDGAVVADVPWGGGLALRGVVPGQDVRLVGVDIEPKMLSRMSAKVAALGLDQVELIEGDMRAIPLDAASVDHLISFSGLHMINEHEQAIEEFARVLKPGGTVAGTTFVSEGTRRKRFLWGIEKRRGIATPPADAAAIESMLAAVGFDDIVVIGSGFANFSAVRG